MRYRATIAVLVVTAIVAAACGDSSEDTTTTAAPTTTQDAATTAPPTTAPTTTQATTTTAAPVSAATEATIGLQLEPPTLDLTASPAAAIPQVLLYNVYETLVRLQQDGSITGLLAESWDVSDDALTYTFNLHDGVTFHNGEPMTAADVVFSVNNVLTKDPAHPFATTLAPVDSVEAVDDTTVVITLSQPSANLLFFLTQGQGVVLEESAIGTIENSPVGTGRLPSAPGPSATRLSSKPTTTTGASPLYWRRSPSSTSTIPTP